MSELIVTEFDTLEYFGNVTLHTKIQNNRPSGGFLANRWSVALAYFFYILCIFLRAWDQTAE